MNEPIQYAVSTSIPSRSTGEAGDSELRRDIVAELCALLGDDVVLLPVQSGSKSPKIKNWQTLTAEDMRRAEYRAELSRSGNVGVLLGNGLITIDLDQDSAVKSFLVLNPKLSGTLRTRRVRGCNFWIRVEGPYPSSCKLFTITGEAFGEWRADKNQTVIHGEAIDRKKGGTVPTAYRIENRAQPIKLSFEDIVWPKEVVLPWLEPVDFIGAANFDKLKTAYGEPFYLDRFGDPIHVK